MPAHLRHGPGSQTAAAFYQEAARRWARDAAGQALPPNDGAAAEQEQVSHAREAHPPHGDPAAAHHAAFTYGQEATREAAREMPVAVAPVHPYHNHNGHGHDAGRASARGARSHDQRLASLPFSPAPAAVLPPHAVTMGALLESSVHVGVRSGQSPRQGLLPAHDGVEDAYDVAPLSLYAGVRGDRSGRPLNVHATPGGPAFTTLALCSVVYVDQKLTNKHLDAHPLDGRMRAQYANDIWYRVALPGTTQGYGYVVGWGDPSDPSASSVPSYLDFRTPDPASTLYHCATPGEGALGIVARHYRISDDVRRLSGDAYADLRFYVNVLSYLNPRSVPSPDPSGLDTANWEHTRVIREDYIWIPSRTFADTLKGKVGSGSYTHGGWGRFSTAVRADWAAAAEEAGQALDFLGDLVALPVLGAGIVAGAATEVWDTLTGLIEAPAAVLGLVQELFSGQLFGLLKGLWDELTAKGGVQALLGTLFGPLEKEWNDADFFKRWFFRGTIIGGAVAFLALTFFSDGIVAALKGLSITAKLADAIRGLDAAQGFVAAARAARETAAGRAVWQAFTLRSLSGSLGPRTLGALLKQRMALQDIKALADGIGPAAVKALVGQGVAGRDILAVAGKLGSATVAKLVAGKMSFADIAYLAGNFDAAVVRSLTVAAAKDLRAAAFLLGPKATTTLLQSLSPQEIESLATVLGRSAVARLISGGLSPKDIKALFDAIGPQAIGDMDRVGVRAADIKRIVGDFLSKIAPARVKQIAATYGGDAMQHYGADFFRDYKGVTRDTMSHLLQAGQIRQGEIVGCHDDALFLQTLRHNGQILRTEVDPKNADFIRYEYKLYLRDSAGNVVQPPTLSTSVRVLNKTVIRGLATDLAKWEVAGNEAADNAIRAKRLLTGGAFRGLSKDGTTLEMIYRPDHVQTFYPVW